MNRTTLYKVKTFCLALAVTLAAAKKVFLKDRQNLFYFISNFFFLFLCRGAGGKFLLSMSWRKKPNH
jgi:hypothetical protein